MTLVFVDVFPPLVIHITVFIYFRHISPIGAWLLIAVFTVIYVLFSYFMVDEEIKDFLERSKIFCVRLFSKRKNMKEISLLYNFSHCSGMSEDGDGLPDNSEHSQIGSLASASNAVLLKKKKAEADGSLRTLTTSSSSDMLESAVSEFSAHHSDALSLTPLKLRR